MPPLPVIRAVAHGVAACGVACAVALLWMWLPGGRDSLLALATVGGIGAAAWAGAVLATHPDRPLRHANDNAPPARITLDWAPIADPDATARALSR